MIRSLDSVLNKSSRFADEAHYMFPVSVDHIWEIVTEPVFGSIAMLQGGDFAPEDIGVKAS